MKLRIDAALLSGLLLAGVVAAQETESASAQAQPLAQQEQEPGGARDPRALGNQVGEIVASHMVNEARLDKLEAIYSARGDSDKLARVRQLRQRSSANYQAKLGEIRQQMDPRQYEAVLTNLRARQQASLGNTREAGAPGEGAAETEAERLRRARAGETPEERVERLRRERAGETLEERAERLRRERAGETPEERAERLRREQAGETPEQRAERQRRERDETPEQRAERQRRERPGDQRKDKDDDAARREGPDRDGDARRRDPDRRNDDGKRRDGGGNGRGGERA